MNFACQIHETARHRTSWIEAGPAEGPLMILLHGWPELGLVWRHQLEHFAASGWRCIAPDMRGYGNSSAPTSLAAYSVRELVADMVELHDALGGSPALWVGHDWGSAVAWAIAAHHAGRCRGAVSLCVPYLSGGLALQNLLPLVDRDLYPIEKFPAGQWDYWLFYSEHFHRAACAFEADVRATMTALYRRASADLLNRPALTATVRANRGWFGPSGRPPTIPRDDTLLAQNDFERLVTAFEATGFAGANAWYMNDTANLAYAAEAPNFGRISLPVLFVHAAWDPVCRTTSGAMADPMQEDCPNLSEAIIAAGHELMLEKPAELNTAISKWLDTAGPW
jgi:pimeloyl-ACP methyl ester carboxylesterase